MWLLLEKGADTEVCDQCLRHTPLISAAGRAHEAIVALLLENGANIEAESAFGSTPLSEAALYGHTAILSLLLEKGANPETRNRKNAENQLLTAARFGDEDVVKRILETRVNLETVDKRHGKMTALGLAAYYGHMDVAELLIKKGANLEARFDMRSTPLFYAVRQGYDQMVSLLLDNGANLEATDVWKGRYSLMLFNREINFLYNRF